MEFKPFHKDFFKAINGAYSRVTDREHYDSQITLTDIEAEIVIKYFGNDNIQIGNVGNDPDKSRKTFFLYNNSFPTFEPISLNLVYPKPTKQELRLYISKQSGYKPNGGEIWFIYENFNHELVIGSMEEKVWNSLGQNDTTDDDYQSEIENSIIIKTPFDISPTGKIESYTTSAGLVYRRNPKLAVNRLFKSEFKCEVNPSHLTFLGQKTNLPFMEAHHFIPMQYQNLYNTPLDNLDNIICLCPNCHRAMHHAVVEFKYKLVKKIYIKRPEMHSFSFEDIAQYYNCLEII